MPQQDQNNKREKSYWKTSSDLILHIHPHQIRKDALKFSRTFGLGGMAALLIVLQVLTGTLLRFRYMPIPEYAYNSIEFIINEMIFGQFIRNIHHWSGMLILIITFLHLLRTFFSEAYLPPRKGNWLIGIGLLFGVVLMNFSGYLLPWDQLSYWAITVSTSMLDYIPLVGDGLKQLFRGGEEVTAITLLNFYTFHTAVLPIVLLILMAYHFWKVRKAGGIVLPETGKNEYVNTIPNLVRKEFVVGLILIAFVFIISIIFDAPLQDKANPAYSPDPAKAPWYFLGVQELILHFHPVIGAFLIPILVIVGMFIMPYLNYRDSIRDIDIQRKNYYILGLFSGIAALAISVLGILADEYVFDWWMTGSASFVSDGLIPFLIWLVILFVFYAILKIRYQATLKEVVYSLFIYFTVSYLVLMFTGIWFRGSGMELMWPWQIS